MCSGEANLDKHSREGDPVRLYTQLAVSAIPKWIPQAYRDERDDLWWLERSALRRPKEVSATITSERCAYPERRR